MVRKTIREVIVVEGKHDSDTLKKYYDCDTIETGGTSLPQETLDLIKEVQKKRGVIVFTDPDSPGNRIRNVINQTIPGCKNAFVEKKDARTEKKVGVEHADFEVLDEALSHLVTIDQRAGRLTMQDLYELGLAGRENSSALREKAGSYFHIGMGSAKTMLARMNCLNLTKEDIGKALRS